jgi:hypothetical protein
MLVGDPCAQFPRIAAVALGRLALGLSVDLFVALRET